MRNQGTIFGYSEVSQDKASRFNVPMDFTHALGTDQALRLTVSLDERCLEIRTLEAFNALVDDMRRRVADLDPELATAVINDYLGYSFKVQIDSAQRLTIPKKVRDIVGSAELVLLGIGDAVQVWNKAEFAKVRAARRALLKKRAPELVHAALGLAPAPRPREDGDATVDAHAESGA